MLHRESQLKCCIASRKCAHVALMIIALPLIMVSCIIKPNSAYKWESFNQTKMSFQ